jgi:hypothetical protein
VVRRPKWARVLSPEAWGKARWGAFLQGQEHEEVKETLWVGAALRTWSQGDTTARNGGD